MFKDLKWSRGDLALAISIGSILAAIAGPFVGDIVDKHGSARIMAAGALASGICLMLLGSVHELWQAFVVFSLLSLFRVGFVTIPGMTMVSNWFVKKRGLALGIMTAGQGMGGLILSPLTTYLISSLGWRIAWVGIGILTCAIMIPAALLLAKQRPETVGLLADGVSSENPGLSSPADHTTKVLPARNENTLKVIFKMPAFWLIALLYPLYLFGHASIFQHGYSLFIDRGIPVAVAGTLWSMLGLFSLSGKIVLGYLSDRLNVKYVMILALFLAAVAILLLILLEPTLGAWMFIIIWGFWECGIMALQPVLVANTFDKKIIGKMLGIFAIFTVFPQILGPSFMGYVFDFTGSYNLALFVLIVFYLASLVMVFFVGTHKIGVPFHKSKQVQS